MTEKGAIKALMLKHQLRPKPERSRLTKNDVSA